MSFLFCKLFLKFLYYPKTVISTALIVSLFFALGLTKLSTDTSLLDLFNDNSNVKVEAQKFEKDYGGLSELVLISQNADSTANQVFIDSLSKIILSWPELFFIESHQDFQFLEQNKWLYANLEDLELFKETVDDKISQRFAHYNPLLEDLLVEEDPQENLDFLSEKYTKLFLALPSVPSNWQILRIYPNAEGTNFQQNKPFINKIQKLASKMAPPGTALSYTGALLKSVEHQEVLSVEAKKSALISAGLILLFLIIFFIRQPLIPFVAIIPLSLSLLWSAGFMGWFLGYTNLLCLTLSFILVGVGSDSLIHLLSRYGEERRKGLGPVLSLENIILETGPAITTANLSSAAAFLCLALFPFQGFKDFGIVAGISLLFTWVNSMLVFPAILILLQSKKNFKVFGKKIKNHIQFEPEQNKKWKYLVPPLLIALVIIIPSAPPFDDQLQHLSIDPTQADLDLMELQQFRPYPIFYQTPNAQTADAVVKKLKNINRNDEKATLNFIFSGSSLIPKRQEAKIVIINHIQSKLGKLDLKKLSPKLKEGLENFLRYEPKLIEKQELPPSLQTIFEKTSDQIPGLVLAFPKAKKTWSLEDAKNIVAAAPPIDIEGKTYYPTGIPLLISEYLDSTLPHLGRIFLITFALVFLLIALDMKSWQYILLALFPVALSIPIGLWFLGFFNRPINPYNLFLIPFLIGYSVDGSLHLVNRYKEEGIGSIRFIYKRTGNAVILATITSALGFVGLAISDHPLLRSFGILPILALGISLIASHLILPIALAILDATRWSKYRQ